MVSRELRRRRKERAMRLKHIKLGAERRDKEIG